MSKEIEEFIGRCIELMERTAIALVEETKSDQATWVERQVVALEITNLAYRIKTRKTCALKTGDCVRVLTPAITDDGDFVLEGGIDKGATGVINMIAGEYFLVEVKYGNGKISFCMYLRGQIELAFEGGG